VSHIPIKLHQFVITVIVFGFLSYKRSILFLKCTAVGYGVTKQNNDDNKRQLFDEVIIVPQIKRRQNTNQCNSNLT